MPTSEYLSVVYWHISQQLCSLNVLLLKLDILQMSNCLINVISLQSVSNMLYPWNWSTPNAIFRIKKVLVSIRTSIFFAKFQYFIANKVLDSIVTNTFFFSYGYSPKSYIYMSSSPRPYCPDAISFKIVYRKWHAPQNPVPQSLIL